MNDNNHFCQGDRCRLIDGQFDNSIDWADHSNTYFDWANKVIENVLEEYPDKWFTTYAYMGLYDSPTKVEAIHPRMVTFITYGRSRWADPELEAKGHEVHSKWSATGSAMGWYDYSYGAPYVLPRVWFHQMGKNIRYGHEHSLRGYHAESVYNWGEGPKLYLTMRLLWDPTLDVDEVLAEWYERTVGEAAAPELAAYYAHWEDFWTRRVMQSSFVKGESVWGGHVAALRQSRVPGCCYRRRPLAQPAMVGGRSRQGGDAEAAGTRQDPVQGIRVLRSVGAHADG